ncbi:MULTISPECIES: manganese efflux pump [Halalkalibacter]|jgi:putative Mn2+ efflux pump MntP|uniref:Manganese efflux pump n=1 Tax=Halalkalibacter alkaliphilus TaxID=2917993 RepID=A0A9X2CSG3_9BACI|nr:manganese efflux pump [Halalkalibacter alkaliphilus]MCL7747431.1 manganese efflux pump [Halalkalibacter alkaliphilus]
MLAFILLLLLSMLVSIDAFAIGFLFGLKKIRIPLLVVAMIALFSAFVVFFSMGIGRFIGDLVPTSIIQTMAGILLIGIAVFNLIYEIPLYRRSYFVMIALLMNVDSFGYGIQAGLSDRSFWFAPMAGMIIFFAFIIGVIHGHEIKSRFIIRYMAYIPSILFLLLGISKLLF